MAHHIRTNITNAISHLLMVHDEVFPYWDKGIVLLWVGGKLWLGPLNPDGTISTKKGEKYPIVEELLP